MHSRITYSLALRKYIRAHSLEDKLDSIVDLLGNDAQDVIRWAESEARRRKQEGLAAHNTDLGGLVFELLGSEAAVRLVRYNQSRGRLTTRSEVSLRTGHRADMPQLYQDAGLRHPQEARNLRHNLFHQSFTALVSRLFPDVTTSVPVTGEGLTPDLIVTHKDPDWTLCVEYKGYRSITLLSEAEIIKAMRYQEAYGSAWLVTTTVKTVQSLYGTRLSAEKLIRSGTVRLERIVKRKAFTDEQREIRGIAKKGLIQLEKARGISLQCMVVPADDMIRSCREGKPIKGLTITTGLEFAEMLEKTGLADEATQVTRIMKLPTDLLHSDSVTSLRLVS
ncbi:MAG: hypothetical protein C4K47_09570 [Candidatus Thorarchaeota archaeon]|nr:MAG: hypothetical protein C4K47_09570 [Candidatus Thorarchaeota archaeon]